MLWQCNTCHCLQILITAQLLQLPFSFWGVICFSWFLNGLIIYYSLLLSCLSLFCFCLLVIRPDNPEPSQRKERDLTPGNFILTSTHRLWHLPSHFANPLLPSFHPSVLLCFHPSVLLSFLGIKSCCVAQAGFKLLGTSVPPVSVSQVSEGHIPPYTQMPSF